MFDRWRKAKKDHVAVETPEGYLGDDYYEIHGEAARRAELLRRYHEHKKRPRREVRIVDGVAPSMLDD